MAWLKTQRVLHDIERGTNLDLLIRGFHGIGNRLADSISSVGTGLQAIALALSTPHDNSEEVKALTERLKRQADILEQTAEGEHRNGG